jgi:hypothetical protein
MSADIDAAVHTKVYTTADGRVTIEQPDNSIVLTSAEEILAVIKELNVCYDYCAAWKEVPSDDSAVHTKINN